MVLLHQTWQYESISKAVEIFLENIKFVDEIFDKNALETKKYYLKPYLGISAKAWRLTRLI